MGIGAYALLALTIVFAVVGISFLAFGNKLADLDITCLGMRFTTRNAGGMLVGAALILSVVLVNSGLLGTSSGNLSAGSTRPTQEGATASDNTIPPGQPDISSQVLAAYNSFCQALHNNQLDAAFSDLTPGYQQSIGTPSNLPHAVGGTFGQSQETASDCSVFFPPNIRSDNRDAVELGNVVVTDSEFGTHTIARNFELVRTNGRWLINNIYGQ